MLFDLCKRNTNKHYSVLYALRNTMYFISLVCICTQCTFTIILDLFFVMVEIVAALTDPIAFANRALQTLAAGTEASDDVRQ